MRKFDSQSLQKRRSNSLDKAAVFSDQSKTPVYQ